MEEEVYLFQANSNNSRSRRRKRRKRGRSSKSRSSRSLVRVQEILLDCGSNRSGEP